jgi:hypothetical protein
MSQPVLAVLSHQQELAAVARRRIAGDANEASLLVGTVISRAFKKLRADGDAPVSASALLSDLDILIGEARGRGGKPS